MPYGSKSRSAAGYSRRRADSRAGQKAARAKKVDKSRNKAVGRIYRRVARVPRTLAATNTTAITTLAKQVRSLQQAQLGQYQKCYECASIVQGAVNWNSSNPICFAANNFLEEANIYIGHADTTTFPGTTVPGYVVRQHWEKQTHTGQSKFGMYDYWYHANDDTASPTAYKAYSTTLKFNFKANLDINAQFWCRIDVVRPKKILLHTNARQLGLPMNIQALGDLAHDDMMKRNRLNRDYFQVMQTKFVKLVNTTSAARMVEQFQTMYLKFPDRSTTQKLDVKHDIPTPQDPHSGVSETFLTNMPEDEVYWVILSTSHTGSDADVIVDMTRLTRFRDNSGVAS